MNPAVAITPRTSVVASIDATEFERARQSPQTAAFVARNDALRKFWAERGLNHAPDVSALAPD